MLRADGTVSVAVRRSIGDGGVWRRLTSLSPTVIPSPRSTIRQKLALTLEITLAQRWLARATASQALPDVVAAIAKRAEADVPPVDAGLRAPDAIAAQLAHVVERTSSALPYDARCLRQSLVLLCLLARRQISATLVIGVRSGPDFEAHAWVEHEGRPVLPALDFRETRLLEISLSR